MLVHERRIPRTRRKLANIGFVRNLFFMLIIFNIVTFAHTQVTRKVTSKSTAIPLSESIVYQFVGSTLLVGGLCLLTPVSKYKK